MVLAVVNNDYELEQMDVKTAYRKRLILGPAYRILGMNIIRDKKKRILSLSQETYIEKVLKAFGMSDSKSTTTPLTTHFKLKSLDKKERKGCSHG